MRRKAELYALLSNVMENVMNKLSKMLCKLLDIQPETPMSDEDIKRIAAERNRICQEEWEEWKAKNKDRQLYPPGPDLPPNRRSLKDEHSEWTANQPGAKYETIDMISAEDQKVLDFLADLGVNTKATKKVTLVIENNKPLEIVSESYAIASTSNGSTLEAHPIPKR